MLNGLLNFLVFFCFFNVDWNTLIVQLFKMHVSQKNKGLLILHFHWFGFQVCPEGLHLSGLTKGQKLKRQFQTSMVTSPQALLSQSQWSLQPIRTRTKMWHCFHSCTTHQQDGLGGLSITKRKDSGRLGRVKIIQGLYCVTLLPCLLKSLLLIIGHITTFQ